MKTHLTWSTEEPDGICPECKEITVLVYPHASWNVDSEDLMGDDDDDEAEVNDEVTGHYCRKCRRLRSLSLNTR